MNRLSPFTLRTDEVCVNSLGLDFKITTIVASNKLKVFTDVPVANVCRLLNGGGNLATTALR